MTASLEIVARAARGWLGPRPLILGICGSQGSGKSTLARGLVDAFGVRAATLSLDDLYLGKAARAALARDIHPLFATRGVPLTHDVALGRAILDAVRAGQPVRLPRFDKAGDEPLAQAQWEAIDAPLDLLIFEGWCVGAHAQPAADLIVPVNDLERARRSATRLENDVLDIGCAFQISLATDDVLEFRQFDRPAADIGVAGADRLAHLLHGDAEVAQSQWIENDVVS